MPVVRNRTMNARKKSRNDPAARKKSTAPTLRAMTTNVQNVTRAPPTLPESPPIGRDTDPTTVLRAANQAVAYSGNWVDMRTGKLAE